jgi:hypothetical protein
MTMKSCEDSLVTEIFFSPETEFTVATRSMQPGNTRGITFTPSLDPYSHGFHSSNDLMAWNDRQRWWNDITFNRMQIGMTDTTSFHSEKQFTWSGYRYISLDYPERRGID